jgi:hypothetical protein
MTDTVQSSSADIEQAFLEDNIQTIAFHLGREGARLVVSYGDGPRLVVDPGESLKEASRRLAVAQPPVRHDEQLTPYDVVYALGSVNLSQEANERQARRIVDGLSVQGFLRDPSRLSAVTVDATPAELTAWADELQGLFDVGDIPENETRKANAVLALLRGASHAPQEAWQPIETAPKDGTDILVWPYWSDRLPAQVHWRDLKRAPGRWEITPSFFCAGAKPTQWMPLPTPPVTRPHQRGGE